RPHHAKAWREEGSNRRASVLFSIRCEPTRRFGSAPPPPASVATMPPVNKLGKVIGFLGGALAILWAMRDRLVSIAAPQDPEPPRFRVVPPSGPPPVEDDLTAISGIGPVFAG